MKHVLYLTLCLPGAAFAHGGHAPLPEPAHAMSHLGPVIGVGVILAALALGLLRGRGS